MLNFNIGVTLAGQGEIEAAIGHFETAAASRPGYASPYYFLGDLHRQVGRPLRGMLYFARFVTLEPNTERTVQAARAAFGLFFWGIEARSETEVELNVSMEVQDDPFGALEVARTIAAVSIYVDDPEETGADEPAEDEPKTEADRKVDAFVTFLQIALEMGSEPELEETADWQLAMAPLLEIHAEGGSEALGYLMASRAGIPGGQSWIESHTSEIDELSGLLNRIAEGGTP